MIAQDAMYHRNCLTDLYKKANAVQLDGNYSDSETQLHGIAFSEVVTYIDEMTSTALKRNLSSNCET